MNIALSPIDEERFGFRTARVSALSRDDLPSVLEFCHTNQVSFLVARCPGGDLRTVQTLEQNGFLLMDTLVCYQRPLTTSIPTADIRLRPVEIHEAEQVSRLAAEAFHDYNGHYHADERLDRAKCDEIYPSWAYRSCISRQVADQVLVSDFEGALLGFVTLKLNNPLEGEVPLYGVLPAAQKQHVGRGLIISALEWFRAKGAERMVISTQVTNLASQKVWIRLGFEPSEVFYTFHKWFD